MQQQKHNAKVQPPFTTSDMNGLSQILNDGDANDAVLIIARPSTILVKSFTSTDNCEFDLNHLPPQFNTPKGGRQAAVIPIKSTSSVTSLTKTSE